MVFIKKYKHREYDQHGRDTQQHAAIHHNLLKSTCYDQYSTDYKLQPQRLFRDFILSYAEVIPKRMPVGHTRSYPWANPYQGADAGNKQHRDDNNENFPISCPTTTLPSNSPNGTCFKTQIEVA